MAKAKASAKRQTRQQPASRIDQIAARINRMPRTTRIIVSVAVTLILVILASLVIDRIFIQGVYDGKVDPMTPALVAVALGLVLYGLGWWSMVGFDLDSNRPWQAGRAAVIYIALGGAGLILTIVLIAFGLVFGYYL